jgi:hypothetical protein
MGKDEENGVWKKYLNQVIKKSFRRQGEKSKIYASENK